MVDADEVRRMLVEVLEELNPGHPHPTLPLQGEETRTRVGEGRVGVYELAARQLWRAAPGELRKRRNGRYGRGAWTWRYVQGVAAGTIRASEDFGLAVRRLAEALDGKMVEHTGMREVVVLAREEDVGEGAVVLGRARRCEGLGCRVRFVPRVPWQRFCSAECRKR